MNERFARTALLIGEEAVNSLTDKKVIIFGIGGVGGYVAEALVRSGIGSFDLVDNDTVCISNINRQIIATTSTIGRYKTEVMKERMLDINPDVQVEIHQCFYLPENKDSFDFTKYDYIVDAVDTVTAKLTIIEEAKKAGVPVISAMGAGNKLNPALFEVADISKTSVCPLAKVMRRELKKRGITHVKVVYSKEEAMTPIQSGDAEGVQNGKENEGKSHNEVVTRRTIPGSIAFVPSTAGLVMAGEIIRDLCGIV